MLNILTLSDRVAQSIYNTRIRDRFASVDLAIGCGDLPYYYLEFIISSLDVPLVFVRGNHDHLIEYTVAGPRSGPHGGINLHRKSINHSGVLIAGVEGCLRYNPGAYQYTQNEMWGHIIHLFPTLLLNRLRYGRSMDIFISHAPPWGINDQPDLPHQGIKAFRWLIEVFQPTYHFHGHIHPYHPNILTNSRHGRTRVQNVYGYHQFSFPMDSHYPSRLDKKDPTQ